MDTEPHDIMQILKEFNQEYVLSFWNDLTDEERVNIIKNKYGKNSILKGMNLEEGATTIDRNNQVGGHKG